VQSTAESSVVHPLTSDMRARWVEWGKDATAAIDVRLTDQTLSCTARAHVPKPERHAARRM